MAKACWLPTQGPWKEAVQKKIQTVRAFPHLDDFSDGVEHLAGNSDGSEEVCLASWVDQLLARVVPVEVHDGLLQPQQEVDHADHQVDDGRVARLVPQVVLPVVVVPLAGQLQEPEQAGGELSIVHVLLASRRDRQHYSNA